MAVGVSSRGVSLGAHTWIDVGQPSVSVCAGFKLVPSLQAALRANSCLYAWGGGLEPSGCQPPDTARGIQKSLQIQQLCAIQAHVEVQIFL